MKSLSSFILLFCCLFFSSEAELTWRNISNPRAVCNDFSRAGYFIRRQEGSLKWVIFLESGGLCYSAESCNSRFVRPDIIGEGMSLRQAWFSSGLSEEKRISPFMTSMSTIGSTKGVHGRDLLDMDSSRNPSFYNYNHVLIPYCSSDAWLANDSRPYVNNISNQSHFLKDFYEPDSKELQFVFRGSVIFRSVIEELIANESLEMSTDVVLAGSSAGGLGVVNHASWVEEMLNMTHLSIITDSSWFINFRGNIFNRFAASTSGSEDMLSLISSVPQCSNNDSTSPCCIRLHCMLNSPEFFPVGRVPVISIVSLHDLFILSDTLRHTVIPGTEINSSVIPDIGLDFLSIISEYGGSMNTTVASSASLPGISFIITECFQHIYLATSTLWDHNGIFSRTAVVELSRSLGPFSASYSHNITSGTWSKYFFSGRQVYRNTTLIQNTCEASNAPTIQDAITMWLNCSFKQTLTFADHCKTVHCNPSCPDEIDFTFDLSNPRNWIVTATTVVVITITVLSIKFKVLFWIWESLLSLKQTLYLHRMDNEDEEQQHYEETDGPKFPECSIEEAVSVACVDLRYSIDFHPKKVKNEKEDKTTISLVIDDDNVINKEKQKLKETSRGSSSKLLRRPSEWPAQFILKQRSTSSSGLGRKSVVVDDDLHDGEANNAENNNNNNEEGIPSSGRRESRGKLPRQPFEVSEDPPVSPVRLYSKKISNASSIDPLLSSVGSRTLARNFLPSLPPPPVNEEVDLEESQSQYQLLQSNSSVSTNEAKRTPGLCGFGRVRKEILQGISLYFNPGELVGIMGPSGCGKTTFLDLLTGRRNKGNKSGHIYINGYPLEQVRKKYIYSTGYVLQLATPYYEELTVRENLTLSSHMRLPPKMTWREKFERVEQVMNITGLTDFQNTVVGGSVGPGLSGGQKRRLVIALQLLTMPSVIFLDEPTSGLDATSSIELLSHLNELAYSNRTVVLTIHQPRFEIFYMFHKLILLSDGKVAYHGVPQKAYSFFVEALMNKYLNRGLLMPQLEEHNPADVIMDMLGKPWMREVILEHYQTSTEPELIKWAIKRARVYDFESASIATLSRDESQELPFMRHSSNPAHINPKKTNRIRPQASWFARLAVLEARASKRANLIWLLYLPVIFFVYGFVLGTTYLQQEVALFVLSGFCVYSVASALFMFPVLQNYYIKALEVYRYEKADGAGRAQDIIVQGFIRFATMGILPVVFSAGVLYLLTVRMELWDGLVFFDLAVINMALNQTWIALLTFVICAFPSYCARMSPMISSVAGFSSGFFVPRDSTGWYYRWIFYINPNYYGFSAVAKRLLSDFNNDCDNVDVECYINSGNFILHRYGFSDVRPFVQVSVLLLMTVVFLLLALISHWLRHTTVKEKIIIFFSPKKDLITDEDDESSYTTEDDKGDSILYHDDPIEEETEEELMGETEDERRETEREEVTSLEEPMDVVSDHDDVFEVTSPASDNRPPSRVKWSRLPKQFSHGEKDNGEVIELKSVKSPKSSSGKLPNSSASDIQRRHSNKRPRDLDFERRRRRLRGPSCLLMEDQSHIVYQPKPTPPKTPSHLGGRELESETPPPPITPGPGVPTPAPRTSLKERQQDFDWHVKATQEIVKERTEEIINDEPKRGKLKLRDVTRRVTQKSRSERQPKMANVVADAMAKLKGNATSETDQEEDEEAEEDWESNGPLSVPANTTFTTTSIANAWRERAKKNNSAEARKSMILVPVNKIPELKKRVSMSSLRPEPSPVVPWTPSEDVRTPKSILRKKNSSDKSSPSPFSRFPGIEEEENEDELQKRGSRGSRQLEVVPSYFFAGTEKEERRHSGRPKSYTPSSDSTAKSPSK